MDLFIPTEFENILSVVRRSAPLPRILVTRGKGEPLQAAILLLRGDEATLVVESPHAPDDADSASKHR